MEVGDLVDILPDKVAVRNSEIICNTLVDVEVKELIDALAKALKHHSALRNSIGRD